MRKSEETMEPIRTSINNAELLAKWIKGRGGIAVWKSQDFSEFGKEMFTPAFTDGGEPKPYPKPSWKVGNEPERIVTDPSQVILDTPKEVKRFRIGVRPGSQGLVMKVTDGGTRRIRAALAKYGEDSWYEFDYFTQEAVIFVPGETMTLKEYLEQENERGRN
jgi:hypothetical protein